MLKLFALVILMLLCAVPTLAQTAERATPSPVRTEAPVDLTATQLLAKYTATAEAFPVPAEQVDEFGGFTFTIVIGSMLIVLIPLAIGLWRINSRK